MYIYIYIYMNIRKIIKLFVNFLLESEASRLAPADPNRGGKLPVPASCCCGFFFPLGRDAAPGATLVLFTRYPAAILLLC